MQRRTFIELRSRGADDGLIQRSFRWFGSYLLWMPKRPDGLYFWSLKVSWVDPEAGQAMLMTEADESPGAQFPEEGGQVPPATEEGDSDPSPGSGDDAVDRELPQALANIGISARVDKELPGTSSGHAGSGIQAAFDANRGEGADAIMRCRVFVSHMRGRKLGLVNPRNPADSEGMDQQLGGNLRQS
jgi:hypothetical protein